MMSDDGLTGVERVDLYDEIGGLLHCYIEYSGSSVVFSSPAQKLHCPYSPQ